MALSYEDLTIVNHRYRVAEQFPPIRYKSISATARGEELRGFISYFCEMSSLRVVISLPNALARPAKI